MICTHCTEKGCDQDIFFGPSDQIFDRLLQLFFEKIKYRNLSGLQPRQIKSTLHLDMLSSLDVIYPKL